MTKSTPRASLYQSLRNQFLGEKSLTASMRAAGRLDLNLKPTLLNVGVKIHEDLSELSHTAHQMLDTFRAAVYSHAILMP